MLSGIGRLATALAIASLAIATPALAKDAGVMNQRRPGAIREDFSRLRALATQ